MGLERVGADADLIGQRRQAQFDTLTCIEFSLAVQRLMLTARWIARTLLAASPWAAQMQALEALKGAGPVVAATVLAEAGDFSRFAHLRQLVAGFGPAPGERSSGSTVRPRGITKASSSIARTVLCETAWQTTY